MLEMDILNLIQQGEGATLEFKRDDTDAATMAKEIVAFANMNGGIILVGVDDSGEVTGLHKENYRRWLMDTVIARHVRPRVLPHYEEVAVGKFQVAVVCVYQGNSKPHVLRRNEREDIYVRYDGTCQHVKREQIARLHETGGLLSVERFPVHGSSIQDLDMRRCREYFDRVYGEASAEAIEDMLDSHGFLVEEPKARVCSYFAYAAFAKNPSLLLPQATARFSVFRSVEKDYDSEFDRTYEMPLLEYRGEAYDGKPIEPALHERMYEDIESHTCTSVLRKTTRQLKCDYPPEAVRELLINAFVHRDWTKPNYVRVVAYPDRMEVISPGALPNSMTVDKIKNGVQMPRNQQLVRIFRAYGYLEDLGIGIRNKVIPLMEKHNGYPPDFEATDDSFKVILRKKA